MNDITKKYDELNSLIQSAGISTDIAEVQGMIIGMLSGGMAVDNKEWLGAITDFISQGGELSPELVEAFNGVYSECTSQLVEPDFALTLMLPDDASPINERGQAVIKWVQGFMLGFGLHQQDLTSCSEDVKEALEDFSEISRMDEDMPEDEASEQALYEVIEYLRISAMLCFNELSRHSSQSDNQSKTLH